MRKLSPDEIQQLKKEAAELRAVLAAGVSDVSVDGQRVTYDLGQCRKRLRDINQLLHPDRRPVISSIYLGGF